MRTRHHLLAGGTPGTQRQLTSLHFGPNDAGRKVYLQASLHADELPGMLVAHHLRAKFAALEAAGRLRAEVVLVPVANPIGLAQALLRQNAGRFDLHSGENFNRHFPSMVDRVREPLAIQLGDDLQTNAQRVRSALREAASTLPEPTELASLRKTLMSLACDAEVVLDLHCDCESLAHLYTATPLWPAVEPLARLLGAEASLLALESGDHPFDEACSMPWWHLQTHFAGRHPLPLGCVSVTVELRGLHEVSHPQAQADADAITGFLMHHGAIDGEPPTLPPLRRGATALDATEVLIAPCAGLVVWLRELGDALKAGDAVVDVIEPITGVVSTLRSRQDGVFLARDHQRFTTAGRSLAKIVGEATVRSGKLSGD